jgi:hypothetical protein
MGFSQRQMDKSLKLKRGGDPGWANVLDRLEVVEEGLLILAGEWATSHTLPKRLRDLVGKVKRALYPE